MQIKIATRHGHLAEETQNKIREKAEKLLHYFERITMIEITVDLQKEIKVVELLVNTEHKHDFVGKEEHADLFSALDIALAKLEGQIRKYKEKIQNHRRTPPMGDLPPE
ncbi:MAG: ribosome-associated translation inhibitor RaiA [Gemmataceae bacterium]|nr:ribosome-associated translation inhibitor RaiA [Gemmataceae bacterium]